MGLMDLDRFLNPARTSREDPPMSRPATTQVDEDARILAAFKAECDKVGVPYDPAGLVRHHRGNASMAAAAQVMSEPLVVWAHCEWHNCQGDDVVDLDGTPVVALYEREQTANQAKDRAKFGYVWKMTVNRRLT